MAQEKGVIVSFRVDKHLADVLNQVPDKSAFIRDVILRSFYETCPLCRGRGVLPEEVSKWARKTLRQEQALECGCCHYTYPASSLPKKTTDAAERGQFTCPHCQHHEHAH
ncbi:MAG TPA: hypothetical protein P5081_02455 [Phycisphaerae bacterium]|nr:hypothetical protein [Phycisphaerae bacterium]HRW51718.1 hypothetical protein [Phycisphaerae bacterium]